MTRRLGSRAIAPPKGNLRSGCLNGPTTQRQKEKVRKMLVAANDQPTQKLNFIDAIQCLGVSYHFESEIETALQHIYETDYDHCDDKANDDLYAIALLFQWLRQQGYPISCGKSRLPCI
ncbi:hypothetical protein HYC85_000359 [Camellia sinensis]|uniref:Terpene synthase N-terminal domain-containing protein n=1 Tax=Camellia sinensis TaxID=4442 RepID=A0A7J7I288_CAMSI|nr:hypothetical protein HYC85_000359 [Camellia sinensis]